MNNQKIIDIICGILFIFIILVILNYLFKPFGDDFKNKFNLQVLKKEEFIENVEYAPEVSEAFKNGYEKDIKINPPSVFKNKSKVEIFIQRKKYLTETISYNGYKSNENVFGQIADDKPWIALDAASCYWNTNKNRDNGVAEESIIY